MATSTRLARLPDSARLWVFGVDPAPGPEAETRVLGEVEAFVGQWKAHGQPLSAASDWVYDRFLMVAVDPSVTPPSGCSIDALVHRLAELEGELGIEIVGAAPVWYRDGSDPSGPVRRVGRPEFKALAAAGEITPDTVVFDLSITTVGELRSGRWELPASDSWHGRYLP